jgi:hypothetical protein
MRLVGIGKRRGEGERRAGDDPSSPRAGCRLRARGWALGLEGWASGRGAAESAFRAPGLIFEGGGGGVAAGGDVGEEVEEFFGVEDVDEAGGHHGDGLGFNFGDFGVL